MGLDWLNAAAILRQPSILLNLLSAHSLHGWRAARRRRVHR